MSRRVGKILICLGLAVFCCVVGIGLPVDSAALDALTKKADTMSYEAAEKTGKLAFYQLYDINKDKSPELLYKPDGSKTKNYTLKIYGYNGKKPMLVKKIYHVYSVRREKRTLIVYTKVGKVPTYTTYRYVDNWLSKLQVYCYNKWKKCYTQNGQPISKAAFQVYEEQFRERNTVPIDAYSKAAKELVLTPNYSKEENWAYFAKGEDKPVDVFLICPTVDTKDEYNMKISDTKTKESFLGALNMELGIYADSARIYAPYYRQASMKVYGLTPKKRETYLKKAYKDVASAFAKYLVQENNGRPIILAGFSQGADMCYRLLANYFGKGSLENQLVAVYAIGWPCTQELVDTYPQIKPAQSDRDLGVVISFDCEAPQVKETFITPANTKAYGINPLNWKTDETPADKSENKGACFTNYQGEITKEEVGLCGGYLDTNRGVMKVTDVDPKDYPARIPGLVEGGYHIYDYQFFFRNLQENVALRVEMYGK